MSEQEKMFFVRSKVWIEDYRGDVVFGRGRFLILDAIDRLGSIQAAASDLHMSYRAVWCRIKVSEKRLGASLVVRDGRGSRITEHARQLMEQFKKMQKIVRIKSDALYDDLVSKYISDSEQIDGGKQKQGA